MNSGGHFAALITEGAGREIAHKTFHRYITRRKAGGRQSVKDKTTGKAKSAGAQIRRHNEAALAAEIAALLESWETDLASCGLVFVFAPGPSAAAVFATDTLQRGDPRVRGIPFRIHRPTLSEVRRVHRTLCTMLPPDADPVAARVEEVATSPQRQSSFAEREGLLADRGDDLPSSSNELILSRSDSSDELFTLHRATAAGVVDDLAAALSSAKEEGEEVLHALLSVLDGQGKAPLHYAAVNEAAGAPMVSLLLEAGADPTKGDSHGMPPYAVAVTKGIRNAFRLYRGRAPDAWDYEAAQIPEALTAEMQDERKAKEKEKKKAKEKEKKRKKQEEKARQAAEAAARATAEEKKKCSAGAAGKAGDGFSCDQCGKSLKGLSPFTRLEFKYCSVPCVHVHRQALEK